MGAFNLKSKTVLTAVAALLLIASQFIGAGVFTVGAFIEVAQLSITPLLAIFLRHGIEKNA